MSKDRNDKFQEAFRHLSPHERTSIAKISESGTAAQDTVTAADIEQIMAAVALSHLALTAEQLSSIRAMLEGMKGKHNRAEMMQVADNTARHYATENDQQAQSQSPQRQIEKLWADYEHRDKENTDEFEKFYQQGKISYEQMQHMREERARLDALPKESADRIAGEKALNGYEHALGLRVRNEAHANGDHATEEAAGKVVQNTAAQRAELDELGSLNSRSQNQDKQTGAAGAAMHFDESQQSSPVKSTYKIDFADVTHDDVQYPGGAKERSTTKVKS